MKTENVLDNRARFFAAYWGSPIVHTGKGKPIRGLGKEVKMSYETADKFQACLFSNQRVLSLRSISSITDDEYMHVGKLIGVWSKKELAEIEKAGDNLSETHIGYGKIFCKGFGKGYGLGMAAPFAGGLDEILEAIDYLRSIGILIPWMDLSVEDIKAYGWAKEVEV